MGAISLLEPLLCPNARLSVWQTGVAGRQRHNLWDGDRVSFREVGGTEELNSGQYAVKVISPFAFSIGDTRQLPKHTGGGVVCQ
jgi:protocatechuate 3,4-dioxygenase beta subunit